MDFGRAVSACLDPVLVPAGFAAGQSGGSQVIFCAAHDDLSDRYPTLPQSDAYERGSGRCIDLLVEHDKDGALRLDLEGRSLAQTLHSLHLDDADMVERTVNAPLSIALPGLADVLSELFHSSVI